LIDQPNVRVRIPDLQGPGSGGNGKRHAWIESPESIDPPIDQPFFGISREQKGHRLRFQEIRGGLQMGWRDQFRYLVGHVAGGKVVARLAVVPQLHLQKMDK